MEGIIFASIVYIIWALTNLVDKALLSKNQIDPLVYTAFGITVSILLTFLLIPLGFFLPSSQTLLYMLIGGAGFMVALIVYFKALQHGEVSVLVPLTALLPLFTFGASYLFFGKGLLFHEVIAMAILIVGAIVVNFTQNNSKNYFSKTVLLLLLANALFAVAYAFQGRVYEMTPFWNGFIWMQIFGFFAVLILMMLFSDTRTFRTAYKESSSSDRMMFLGIGIANFGVLILLNYTFTLIPVAVVNALRGIQYIASFVFVIYASKLWPLIYREDVSRNTVIQRALGIAIIVFGLLVLSGQLNGVV